MCSLRLLRSEYWQFLTDVLGQPVGPIDKGQESWPLKMRPIGLPEMSIRNCHYSLRNSPVQCSSRESVNVIALATEF